MKRRTSLICSLRIETKDKNGVPHAVQRELEVMRGIPHKWAAEILHDNFFHLRKLLLREVRSIKKTSC